jgi:hypothetical protein
LSEGKEEGSEWADGLFVEARRESFDGLINGIYRGQNLCVGSVSDEFLGTRLKMMTWR